MPAEPLPTKAKILREIRRLGRQLVSPFREPGPSPSRREKLLLRAVKTTQRNGWRSALPLWEEFWAGRHQGLPQAGILSRTLPTSQSRTGNFVEVEPAPSGMARPHFCVYTTLFGNYDDLKPPVHPHDGIAFLCFTDQDIDVPGWTTIRLPSEPDPVLQGKRYKLFPAQHLAAYEASLFVDANVLISGDVDRFVRRWCAHEDFVMWRHPSREDMADEAMAVLILGKHEPRAIVDQLETYFAAGMPRSTGLVEANFIWRRHDSQGVQALMSAWWDEIVRHSRRDQISLCFLMWKTGFRPKVFPSSLGSSRTNGISGLLPHNPKLPAARGPAPARPRRLSFLFAEQYRTSGSTIMRGQQLADLMRQRFPDEFDVSYTSQLDMKDAVVVVTKGALATLVPEELGRLKRDNVALVADYVDDFPAAATVAHMDLLLAASIRGFIETSGAFKNVQSEYLPHHADPRLTPGIAPAHVFAAGYFGEPKNVVRYEALAGLVDFIHVNTKESGSDWMERLAGYSLHYAVRPQSRERGAKPFLKGFTAAHCGANIIVTADDGDASYYLGDDYPYLLRSRSETDIQAMLGFAKDSFGGREWRFAQEAMAHIRQLSSASHVAQEFRRILRMLA